MIKCFLTIKSEFAGLRCEFRLQICYALIYFNGNSIKLFVKLFFIDMIFGNQRMYSRNKIFVNGSFTFVAIDFYFKLVSAFEKKLAQFKVASDTCL